MTEEEARAWAESRWDASAIDRLERFGTLVAEESSRQNLVSAASLASLWSRHITDSLQLVPLAVERSGLWLDIGTGGGFPGIAVAAVREDEIILVEPRRRRAGFLQTIVDTLGLSWARVVARNVQDLSIRAPIISARAVASPRRVFEVTNDVRDAHSLLLLPSGRSAESSLEDAQRHWNGVFHVKQSITDPSAGIIVAQRIARK